MKKDLSAGETEQRRLKIMITEVSCDGFKTQTFLKNDMENLSVNPAIAGTVCPSIVVCPSIAEPLMSEQGGYLTSGSESSCYSINSFNAYSTLNLYTKCLNIPETI